MITKDRHGEPDIKAFIKTDKGKEFLGWGWDGKSTINVDGEFHPVDKDGVQMYDSPKDLLDSLLSGIGISNLLGAQPEAPRLSITKDKRTTTGAPIIATTETMDDGAGTWEDVDVEGKLSLMGNNVMGNNVNAAPYASQPGGNYEIQPGDTLSQIAQQYGTTVDDLMDANRNITDRDKIMAGGMLNVPGQVASGLANIANQLDPQYEIAQQLSSGADLSAAPIPSLIAEYDNWQPGWSGYARDYSSTPAKVATQSAAPAELAQNEGIDFEEAKQKEISFLYNILPFLKNNEGLLNQAQQRMRGQTPHIQDNKNLAKIISKYGRDAVRSIVPSRETPSATSQSGTSTAPSVDSNTANNTANVTAYPKYLMNTAQKAGNAIMDIFK